MANEAIRLPPRLFLYTLDQIADMVMVEIETLKRSYVHFDGRSTGTCPDDKMLARNIAPALVGPEWRVDEQELVRWFQHNGYRPLARVQWQR